MEDVKGIIKEKHGRPIRLLLDVLLLSACCLFLISVFQPLLTGVEYCEVGGHVQPFSYSHWSFQTFNSYINKTYTFNNFWFNSEITGFIENVLTTQNILWLFLLVFIVQILTVASGLLSLSLRKKWTALIPFASSATVILLTIDIRYELAAFSRPEYSVGYWLVYPSTLLFLLAFTLSLTGLKNISVKSLNVTILKKVLTALGCFLLLISLFFPFCYAWGDKGENECWSYRIDYHDMWYPEYPTHHWFYDYWFTQEHSVLSLALMSMFIIQVLILVFGIVSFISRRRILLLLLVPLCLGVLGLMIYAGQTFYVGSSEGTYGIGYDLVYPSLIMFLSAFALDEAVNRTKPIANIN